MSRAEIAALLPHGGAMCLLDSVREYSDSHIVSLTMTHRSVVNPLRSHGRLGIMAGVEYAAQAMALHAALQARQAGPAQRGLLASLRSVSFDMDRLDLVTAPLTVMANCQHREATRALYSFTLLASETRLMEGRAGVVLSLS